MSLAVSQTDMKFFLKKKKLYFLQKSKIVIIPSFFYSLKDAESLSSLYLTKRAAKVKALKAPFFTLTTQIFQSFSKYCYEVLVLKGVGFRVSIEKEFLFLNIGYSHVIRIKIPQKLYVTCPTKTTILVSGSNMEQVKIFCSAIQKKSKINPYKGKGIFYRTQSLHLKSFKK